MMKLTMSSILFLILSCQFSFGSGSSVSKAFDALYTKPSFEVLHVYPSQFIKKRYSGKNDYQLSGNKIAELYLKAMDKSLRKGPYHTPSNNRLVVYTVNSLSSK